MFLTQYLFADSPVLTIQEPIVINIHEVNDEQDYIIVTFGEGVYSPPPAVINITEINDEQDYVLTTFE